MPVSVFDAKGLKTALIDFYILSQGVPTQFRTHQPFQPFQRYRLQLINAWKRTLIRDIEFCCACELRHMRDSVATPPGKDWPAWFKQQFGGIGELWFSKWNAGMDHPHTSPPLDLDARIDYGYVLGKNLKNHQKRLRSYASAKAAESQHGLSLIEVSERVFNPALVKWHGAYGGKAWQQIAQTLLSLWHAIDLSEIVHLIDTAFALHHNTNVVFNKNLIWAGDGGYAWIQEYLDLKWAAVSPVSILGFASKFLQGLVRESGFCMGTDLSPQMILNSKTMNLHSYGNHIIRENGKEVVVLITKVASGFFTSIVVMSDAFQVQKTFGKYSKVIKKRVYLLEEFAEKLMEKKVMPAPAEVQAAGTGYLLYGKHNVKKIKLPHPGKPAELSHPKTYPTDVLWFTPIIQAVYNKVEEHVIRKGYALGSLLNDGANFRFRLVGFSKPLRFYFKVTKYSAALLTSNTLEVVADPKLIEQFIKSVATTDFLVKYLKKLIDTHIGQAVKS